MAKLHPPQLTVCYAGSKSISLSPPQPRPATVQKSKSHLSPPPHPSSYHGQGLRRDAGSGRRGATRPQHCLLSVWTVFHGSCCSLAPAVSGPSGPSGALMRACLLLPAAPHRAGRGRGERTAAEYTPAWQLARLPLRLGPLIRSGPCCLSPGVSVSDSRIARRVVRWEIFCEPGRAQGWNRQPDLANLVWRGVIIAHGAACARAGPSLAEP